MLKIAVCIIQVLQKKFIDQIKTIDGLAVIKKARLHIQKDEILETINKSKIEIAYIESLFDKLKGLEESNNS